MKKVLLKVAFFGALLCYSCENTFKDIYGDVKEDQAPSWLGGSIYSELQNPSSEKLTGTFNYYLRLIDDLGESETLSRTGSKTVFPANDEAFERFFANNNMGVTSYDQLTYAQKKLLLKSSMLNNALLTGMLSNVQTGSEITDGKAVKHPSDISVIDSIEMITPDKMPLNNPYWENFRNDNKTIWGVSDNTVPPIVHFTREQMVNNGISTDGEGSDFAILTGEPYSAGTVYVYDKKIIGPDVVCQNGYIHQVQDVLVQPGNMAQIIARESDTKYFSHILDYYKAPYFESDPDAATLTNTYNAWVKQNPTLAAENGYTEHDKIYKVRYLSLLSQGVDGTNDPNKMPHASNEVLNYDIGWNEYYPNSKSSTADIAKLSDMGAMFVPTDDAMWKYFSSRGAFIINEYGEKDASGKVENTREKLLTNLDRVHNTNPVILTSFINNILKTSFVATVPSKFPEIINDASELLNMSIDSLIVKDNGKYDILIANNGVIYKVKGVLAPDRYRSVLGPVCTYHDMKVMDWAVEEKYSNYIGMDFQYYLLAMKANYAFFIPDDIAFGGTITDDVIPADDRDPGLENVYYLDPTSINWDKKTAKVLHFWYDGTNSSFRGQQFLGARAYDIDLTTGIITTNSTNLSFSTYKTQIVSAFSDIMNYHTAVLESSTNSSGDVIKDVITEGNKYYKTKHGAEILVEKNGSNWTVKSGSQIDGLLPASDIKLPTSTIKIAEKEDNGYAYRINRIIQPTIRSVSQVLDNENRFSEFYKLSSSFGSEEIKTLLSWIGISDKVNTFGTTEQAQKLIFTNDYSSSLPNRSLAPEGNVKMFNTYNYTLYAPNNNAMEIAYNAGLPRWEDLLDIYNAAIEAYPEKFSNNEPCPEPFAGILRKKVNMINSFCKYHFQNISLYADNSIPLSDGGNSNYQSLYAKPNQPLEEYYVSCSGGVLTVRDGGNQTHSINANNSSQLSNIMTRDYWLNNEPGSNINGIRTSSFCVIHEITSPLYFDKTLKYNGTWVAEDFTKQDLLDYLASAPVKKRYAIKKK